MKNKAFTLIELLVTIAIISLLSSIVFASMSSAKTKAEDSKMKSEAREVRTAVELYKADKGVAPYGDVVDNLNSSSSQTYLETEPEYETAMLELVTGGYISKMPESPSGTDYAYIVSSDGTQSVFAANLNNPSSNSNSNSCELTVDEPQDLGSLSYMNFSCDYQPPYFSTTTNEEGNYIIEEEVNWACPQVVIPDGAYVVESSPGDVVYGCDIFGYEFSDTSVCDNPISPLYTIYAIIEGDEIFGNIPICDGATSTDYCACN